MKKHQSKKSRSISWWNNLGEEKRENPGEKKPGEEKTEQPGEELSGGEESEQPGKVTPGKENSKNPVNDKASGEDGTVGVRPHHSGKSSSPQLGLNIKKKLIPSFNDRDSDGVPNHLEIYKFKTDPFKKDTDDDGLSDGFEIRYHSATSFYFTFECMENDWRDFVPSTDVMIKVQEDEEIEKWKEIRLSPLNYDVDQNGILDHLEDFDGDEILNVEEQLLGTNPYIHNENEGYVGPIGLELLEIKEIAQKGC